ncbi:hypothetical protein GOV12_02815 [Candidatus Pacearchaeota archaeon]|nr:hypothetical protein [Candidatus Pacearchaeota archaeon]
MLDEELRVNSSEVLEGYRRRVLRGKPIETSEIRDLLEKEDPKYLNELDRLTKIAGGIQHVRYLISPIVLYDNPLQVFQEIASTVRSVNDLRYTSGVPHEFVKEYFEHMIDIYIQRIKSLPPQDIKGFEEDFRDSFNNIGEEHPIRDVIGKIISPRRGHAPEEQSPSQDNAIRILEDG